MTRNLCALLLVVVCLPLVAANNDCPGIRALTADDVQTGEAVTITWSYHGNAVPQSQMLTGHDFAEPVQLAPGQTAYTYTPTRPGEKHVTLSAIGECGTTSVTTKYHVKQCNVVPPAMTVSATSVSPGDVVAASVALQPGHTVRWEVTNGTVSATTGEAVHVTAGGAGVVKIHAFVSRGSSCSVVVTSTVEVVEACPIAQPDMWHPQQMTANQWFDLYMPQFDSPDNTLTAEFRVHGAEILANGPAYVGFIAPAEGTVSIDVIVSNGTCSRTFTKTFSVQACTSSANVTAGEVGACGPTTAVATFTGVAPFFGSWSDGQSFFTWEPRLERPISGGTYSIGWFMDANCEGTISGSVTSGASLPAPSYTIVSIPEQRLYESETCPGVVRTARLNGEVPAGATVEWSITNGTIVGGQGTPEVRFTGDAPGRTELTVVYRDGDGCPSPSYTWPYLMTLGKPEFNVRVEPSAIPAGGTAIITIDVLSYFTGGTDVRSSLGDAIVPMGWNQWEYRSTNGGGVATITVILSTACETTTKTVTLTIDGANPTQARATVRAIGSSCSDYEALAEMTGTPPFTGTWSNGETFTTDTGFTFMRPATGGTYTLTSFRDANGPGTVSGSATFDFAGLPAPDFTFSEPKVCPGSVATATLTTPIPEGATPHWIVYDGEILSGQGTASIQFTVPGPLNTNVNVTYTGPNMCSVPVWKSIDTHRPLQAPQFSTYDIYEGREMTMYVVLDANTTSWGFENSLGDPMEIISSPAPNIHYVRYTSTHGAGTSTIRVWSTNACGATSEKTATIRILPAPPTATLTAVDQGCGHDVTVTFTGTPPFTATWHDGMTFTSNEYTATRFFTNTEYWGLYVHGIRDANAPSDLTSNALYLPYKPLPYVPVYGPAWICAGQTGTVMAELPAGWTIQWSVEADARIVSGQGTPNLVIEALTTGYHRVEATYKTPEGCTGWSSTFVYSPEESGASPVLTLPTTTIRAGESFQFTAAFDGNYQSLNWESSNGDPIWNAGQNGMTFTLQYQSANGPGTTTIKVYGTTLCGRYVESTATLTITE